MILIILLITGILIELGIIIYNNRKSPIIWQPTYRKDKLMNIPYCRKCKNELSMLGLLSRDTKKIQYHCSVCNKILKDK